MATCIILIKPNYYTAFIKTIMNRLEEKVDGHVQSLTCYTLSSL